MSDQDWTSISRALRQRMIQIQRDEMPKFLHAEAPILSGKVADTFYTTGGLGVKVRSGNARRGWTEYYPTPRKAVVANTVPYADFTKEQVIKPKNGRALAIPIGKALTPAGVPRFSGPRDPALPKLSLISRPGKPPLLADTHGKKKMDLYFVLVPSVTIPAYTAGIGPFIDVESKGIRDRFMPVIERVLG